jgi:23S rRNA pseudouridine1911/1915/1917 synthase
LKCANETSHERVVDSYLHGVRIDSFLVRAFRNYTPFRMARMVRAGMVTIDGKVADERQRVRGGQRVQVQLVEPPDKLLEPEAVPLDVIAEDEWLLVVNKPAGMVTHPVSDMFNGTLANAVQHHLDCQTSRTGLLRPGIVHRLDRQTSGLLVIAKDHLTHRRLSIGFQRRRVEKSYLALVEGNVVADDGEITLPIGRRPEHGTILASAASDAVNARPARTLFRVDQRLGEFTLLAVTPQTGRLHQIRVHLAAIGHPVLGDEFYDRDGRIKQQPADVCKFISRHALHAERLAFAHPHSGKRCEFVGPLPTDFRDALMAAGVAKPRVRPVRHRSRDHPLRR